MDAELRAIFAQILKLEPDEVDDGLSPRTNENWDSFGTVELVSAVEERFSVQLEIAELAEFTSFGAVKRLLEKRMAPGRGRA